MENFFCIIRLWARNLLHFPVTSKAEMDVTIRVINALCYVLKRNANQ